MMTFSTNFFTRKFNKENGFPRCLNHVLFSKDLNIGLFLETHNTSTICMVDVN